jgi:hypothetical protein
MSLLAKPRLDIGCACKSTKPTSGDGVGTERERRAEADVGTR